MDAVVDPDLRAVLDEVDRISSQEFGRSPDEDQAMAFVRDLLFGPRDLWPSLRERLITPTEAANAVGDRLYPWLLETFHLPSHRSAATDWRPFIARLSTILAERAAVGEIHMTPATNFIAEWRRLAASDESRRIREIATRLSQEPVVGGFFPYASHHDLHISRNDTYPWDNQGLPYISSRADDDAVYQARDGEFRPVAEGDLETIVRAFVSLLTEAIAPSSNAR